MRKQRKTGRKPKSSPTGALKPTYTVGPNLALANVQGAQTYQIDEQYTIDEISSGSVFTSNGISFNAATMPAFTSTSARFDFYRIENVEILFRPTGITTVVDAVVGNIPTIPSLYVLADYNDVTAPSSLAEMERSSQTHTCPATQAMKISFKPRWQQPIYQSAVSTSYALGNPSTWLNTANGSIPHYGIKWLLTEDAGTGQFGNGKFSYRIFCRMRVTLFRRK